MIIKKARAYISVLLLYGSFVAIPLLFNNCGQRAFYARHSYTDVTKLETELVSAYGKKIAPEICADSAQYVCDHRVYSEEKQNSEADVLHECVETAGVKICPHGKTRTYNSAAAAAACKEGCDENYNYEEYVCYYDLPTQDGIRPLQSSNATLEASIGATYAACMRVASLAQEGQ